MILKVILLTMRLLVADVLRSSFSFSLVIIIKTLDIPSRDLNRASALSFPITTKDALSEALKGFLYVDSLREYSARAERV